jgi:homoserine kinase type II
MQKIAEHIEYYYRIAAPSVSEIDGGTENVSYLISAAKGKFVLTILHKKSVESAQEYTRYLQSLNQASISCPRIQEKKDGGLILLIEGKPSILCEFVEGSMYEAPPLKLIEAIGGYLSKVNSLNFSSNLSPQVRMRSTTLEFLERHAPHDFFSWAKQCAEEYSYIFDLAYPCGPTHGDPFPDNVIFVDERPNFIDWEDGCIDSPLIDIAMAALGLCGPRIFDSNKFASFWLGYSRNTKVEFCPQDIVSSIKYCSAVVAANRFRKSAMENNSCAQRDYIEPFSWSKSLPEVDMLNTLKSI